MYKYNISKYTVVISPLAAGLSFRLASWMLTFVGPASLACSASCALTCISVTQVGCLSTQMPKRHLRLCLSASCWKTQMKQWCGGVLRKQVYSYNESTPKSYHVLLQIVFSIRFPFLHIQQLWLASLCQMLLGGNLMCCWWTHHQGRLMNIWQCWKTWKNTAV